jgi:hypothetical protein
VVKWGYDGHIPLIYLVLLAVKRTHAESLEARTSVYHGAHRCILGTHGSEGACTPAPRGGTHACALGKGAHICALGGRARLLPGGGVHVCAPRGARTPAPAGSREGLRVGWWNIISSSLQLFYFPWAEVGPRLVVLSHQGKKLNK